MLKKIKHGAIPTWYNKNCEVEALFNDDSENTKTTNRTLDKFLKKYKVKSILDLTCGTGSQVFYLLKRGYQVTGADISTGMLKIAKRKLVVQNIKVKLLHGDMRTIKVGKFDAALTIFNSIGHLTKTDFEKTLSNIHSNLNDDGIYIFDILNLNYVTSRDNIIKMSLERMKTIENKTTREIQHSIIDDQGILISYTTFYTQTNNEKMKTSKTTITLQLYTSTELKEMLSNNGFNVLHQSGTDGAKFSDTKTERIVTIAQKVK